ncbi:aminotransferase DegT [Pseudodesulfovibrio sp. F-1]|uniref:Aminotransferase DegT n=1 Tax=Pseudodesulfovibrio alkaliphilus TaxID=2661613 RepID=A0A7K1KN86_9BACT|nr:DegT/DnrJ/EryC1/StrS family aminotransferase [Pseudodesulfovibrio alkaliphilus]MUM77510.1 aminotransferase DegT [Pseudodesulfovibrio alkaliphilus]
MPTSDRLYLSPPHMGGAELDFVHRAFESNFIAPLGPQLAEFEAEFSRLTGFAHCLGLSSGTAAIHLGLRQLGVGPGDVVIASTLTFIGSVTPATFLGADLHFVDCDAATWTMDPALLAEAVDQVEADGRRVGAVIPTDLYGQCSDYDALLAVCHPRGIPLLVDAAEAVGAAYKDRHAGRGGDAAVYSFNGNKIITTGGGGLLASDDKALIDEARRLSQQARDPAPHYQHSTIGYNYRMSNVAAAIGLGQLDVLAERVARRRAIFDWYVDSLGRLPGVSFMPEAAYGLGNRWLTVILLDEAEFGAGPEDVRLALEAENIESRPVWKPMHMQPVFRDVPCSGGAVSEGLFRRGLCLPSGTAMSEAELDRVARRVAAMTATSPRGGRGTP